MSEQPLFEVKGLFKGFDAPAGRLDILKGLQFSLHEGEFLAVVGESGSGKSTMLQILGTLESPDAGEISLEGQSLLNLKEGDQANVRNRKIGFVYQAHHLIPELTALENVCLPLQVQGMDLAKAELRGMELLERLNIGERATHVPAKLSGGEAQRVAVARALAASPCLILADEPTGNLDEHSAQEVFDLLQQLCRQERAAVIMVTHSKALAKACDRTLLLTDGQLVSF
ncbi:ABC transporter ATP-binding protein [Mariprofundus sp. NF]|uniref:ABC transporter ATP-binding protein n=1 Tax=Mariprofundus sp. NF TaxID=2608716 RepID=UPI0015A224C0|nr:ABC transporter ATP-binding protein [Mariprofundus sp. NF]NWF39324.1 ABC transporter ATP-binding protein [Mariprofundus sp. NF]